MVRGGSEEGKIGGNFEKKLQKYSELLERDVKGVGEFFSNLGYSEAAKKFIENKIEGRLLPGLTTDHLIRMGVNIVGDQLRIMEVRIRSGMEFRQGPCRNVLPFKSDEDKIEKCYKHVLVSERNKLAVFESFPFCCFAGPPEMYKLSSTRISIKHIQYHINCFGSFCGYREVKDNIDLTKIVDVDYLSENPGCCSCDVGRSVLQIMDINEKQYLMHLEEVSSFHFATRKDCMLAYIVF
eukprot:jgi/Bigna1/130730/aug1.12_g5438